MAWSNKALSHGQFWDLYHLEVGPSASRTVLKGVQSMGFGARASYFSPQAIGRVLPKFRALNTGGGPQPFMTCGIGQLLTLGCAMAPLYLDGSSGNSAVAYWAAYAAHSAATDATLLSDVGAVFTYAKALLHIGGISAMQDAAALAECSLIPFSTDGTAPWTVDDVASLAAAIDSRATEDECWTFGGVTIDNVAIELATGFSFQNVALSASRTNGSPYINHAKAAPSSPGFVVPLRQPTPIANLGISGLGTFGTQTDPPVDATSAVFRLARVDPNGVRKAVGNGDIEIRANFGSVVAGDTVGGAGEMATSLVFSPFDDDASPNTSIEFTLNATT